MFKVVCKSGYVVPYRFASYSEAKAWLDAYQVSASYKEENYRIESSWEV